jgi:putative acetyltransferase
MLEITTPQAPQEWDAVRGILREYAETLDIDLCFQGFEGELMTLPGQCAIPRAAMLTAMADDMLAGCCALRPLDKTGYSNACEMKRLFVRPQFRASGIGRLLVEAISDAGRQAGCSCVLLDTKTDMEAARALYRDLGFEEIPPCYHNPIAGSHYFNVKL